MTPGKLTVSGKYLRTVSRRFSMAQTDTLDVRLSRAALKRLHRKRRANENMAKPNLHSFSG